MSSKTITHEGNLEIKNIEYNEDNLKAAIREEEKKLKFAERYGVGNKDRLAQLLGIERKPNERFEVPEGYTALRVKVLEDHYDLLVENKDVDHVVEKLGAEVLTDEGLTIDKTIAMGDTLSMREMIERVFDMDLRTPPTPVPHLGKFEYSDRPLLDLGPAPLPRRAPKGRPHPERAAHDKWAKRRRAKNKAAKKARRKNRRKNRR